MTTITTPAAITSYSSHLNSYPEDPPCNGHSRSVTPGIAAMAARVRTNQLAAAAAGAPVAAKPTEPSASLPASGPPPAAAAQPIRRSSRLKARRSAAAALASIPEDAEAGLTPAAGAAPAQPAAAAEADLQDQSLPYPLAVYREAWLGRGGYAQVYQVFVMGSDGQLTRLAEKTYDFAGDDKDYAHIASLSKQIPDHPNLLRPRYQYYNPDTSALHVYYDLADGSITDMLEEEPFVSFYIGEKEVFRKKYPLFIRQKMIKGTVEGLDALHGADFAHCDLKGQNVLVTSDGKVSRGYRNYFLRSTCYLLPIYVELIADCFPSLVVFNGRRVTECQPLVKIYIKQHQATFCACFSQPLVTHPCVYSKLPLV